MCLENKSHCPFKQSPNDDVTVLQASDWLIHNTWDKERQVCGCILSQHLKHAASFHDIMKNEKKSAKSYKKRVIKHLLQDVVSFFHQPNKGDIIQVIR